MACDNSNPISLGPGVTLSKFVTQSFRLFLISFGGTKQFLPKIKLEYSTGEMTKVRA